MKGDEQPYHRGRPGMESISTTSRSHISIDRILNTVRLVLLRRTSGEENRIPSMASSRSTHNLVLLSIILSPAAKHHRTTAEIVFIGSSAHYITKERNQAKQFYTKQTCKEKRSFRIDTSADSKDAITGVNIMHTVAKDEIKKPVADTTSTGLAFVGHNAHTGEDATGKRSIKGFLELVKETNNAAKVISGRYGIYENRLIPIAYCLFPIA